MNSIRIQVADQDDATVTESQEVSMPDDKGEGRGGVAGRSGGEREAENDGVVEGLACGLGLVDTKEHPMGALEVRIPQAAREGMVAD